MNDACADARSRQRALGSAGAVCFPSAIAGSDLVRLRALADHIVGNRPGVRLYDNPDVVRVCEALGPLGLIGCELLGANARAVRAVLFDKSMQNNWIVPWHQDRTIAVRDRRDVPDFGPWSRKSGAWHVEPPFEITQSMVTLRAHLDDCDEHNAPLLYVPGSHRVGKIPADEVGNFARRQGHAVSLAQAGDVWAYATAIVHASEPAATPTRRRVLQVDYAAQELPGGLKWSGI